MLKIQDVRLALDTDFSDPVRLCAQATGLPKAQITQARLLKKSIDARHKDRVHFLCSFAFSCLQEEQVAANRAAIRYMEPENETLPKCRRDLGRPRPVVVGSGPAGLFCALILAQAQLKPILLERGQPVEQRVKDVDRFFQTGRLDPQSNIQFGEGGAGTFSDGKLTTGIKDPRCRLVLQEFVRHGAPEEILTDAKPHIGTDRLRAVVKNMRATILALGGEVWFSHQLDGLKMREDRLQAVQVKTPQGHKELPCDTLVLAIGHSARDTFEMLYQSGLPMEQKPFSVGVRIEHPQKMIDRTQYGKFASHPALPAADYKLHVRMQEGGLYTFCMCPGGQVVAAASEAGGVVTNGMSLHARAGENANSALLVNVDARDFQSDHVLAGIAYQRALEQAAYRAGEGGFRAPAQRVGDFIKGDAARESQSVKPTYLPGVVWTDLHKILPERIAQNIADGLVLMDKKLRGFALPDAILTGVETRSSSPVRILRGQDRQSVKVRGVFPCGEGAGYAGGILSAAVDGIRTAEWIICDGKAE